ncbi:MAG: serine--tRNA ligase, partial [Gammaproteobacteria bacterium]
MLDPRTIRQELTATAEKLRIKGFELDVSAIESLESRRKALQVQTEELQAERNTRSKAIGKAKAAGEDIQPLLDAVASLGDQLDEKKTALDDVQAELNDILMAVPNIPDASVPPGASEDDNVVVRRWGDPTELSFEAKDHVDLASPSGLMNFEAAAKITGARFVALRGDLARLHRALVQFMLDIH